MRFDEDTTEVQARARAAVRAWLDKHPDGGEDEMLAAVGPNFHKHYAVVLKAQEYELPPEIETQIEEGRRHPERRTPYRRRTPQQRDT